MSHLGQVKKDLFLKLPALPLSFMDRLRAGGGVVMATFLLHLHSDEKKTSK